MPRQSNDPIMETDLTSKDDFDQSQIGVRVVGSDAMYGYYGPVYLSSTQGAPAWGLCANLGVLNNGGTAWSLLTPANISSRLSQWEEMYYYYAVRQLMIQFVPSVQAATTVLNGGAGSTSATIDSSAGSRQCAFAIVTQYDNLEQTVDNGNLFGMINQIVPNTVFTAWEGGMLRYNFSGKKLWQCSTSGGTESSTTAQCGLVAATPNGIQNNLSSSIYYSFGTVRVSYVVDFYLPSYIQSNPSLLISTGCDRIIRALRSLGYEYGDEKKFGGAKVELMFPPHMRSPGHERYLQWMTLVVPRLAEILLSSPESEQEIEEVLVLPMKPRSSSKK
jgi:hypothetical protein